jgi:hypothetical protein
MRTIGFLCLLVLLLSCEDRQLSEDIKSQLDEENMVHRCKSFIDSLDELVYERGERFESLVYSNENEELKSVLWYLDDTLSIVRELIKYQKTNEQHELSFYFLEGQLYLAQEIIDISSAQGVKSTELLVLYEGKTPVRAWSNSTNDGNFSASNYKDAPTKHYDPSRALAMFYNEKDFVMHFEDFLESGGEIYLLVNTGKKNNYIAALRIGKMDSFLNELNAKKEKYKNVPLFIQHQAINEGGWIFHQYIRGSFLE